MKRLLIKKAGENPRLVATVKHAETFCARLLGLLGTSSLHVHHGLLLSPCNQVHTIGMRFGIDVVFLDQQGVILRCCQALEPLRFATHFKAAHVLELPAGRVQACTLLPGERLQWKEVNTHKENHYVYY